MSDICFFIFLFQAEDGIRDLVRSRGLGDVYKRQIPYLIIEKNAGVGGTWYENTYPGCRVDVGNHFYCYSFEPNNDWLSLIHI